MRQLSIIDLASGHRPISNEGRSVWVVFNGEIYNNCELCDELIACGHTLHARTDTETNNKDIDCDLAMLEGGGGVERN